MKPEILVYVDHPMCSYDCADATLEVLKQTKLYDVKLFGPDSYPSIELTKKNISKADCIIFPGGEGDADQFDNYLTRYRRIIKNYVNKGGRYIGICQGSYFASKHYFNLLDGYMAKQHIKSKKPSTRRRGPAIIKITWRNRSKHKVYFYDGAVFEPDDQEKKCNILGLYENGGIASLVQKVKKGTVGVIGPHPEAMRWWFYSQRKVREGWKNDLQHSLLLDLVKETLK